MVLSGMFIFKIVSDMQKSFARMGFKSYDMRVSFQLVMLGFLVLAASRVFDLLGREGLNLIISVICGSIATVLMTAAFVILNAVVYGPDNFLYYHLPSNYFGDEEDYM
ncbi:MAG: hypothetical protein ABEK04_05940 [Candidatus Nanohalobium sp.]